jgi:hypothetical protein
MKKTLMVASILAGAGSLGVYAQGSLNWQDSQSGTYLIEILSPSTTTPSVETSGQTTFDEPAGATTYSGGYIGGSTTGGAAGNGPGIGGTPTAGYLGINYQNAGNFEVGLYVASTLAALNTSILSGTPVATSTLLGGNNAGLYNTAAPTYVSGSASGTAIWVGIAAWYSAGGASSYAAAETAKTVAGFVDSSTSVALGGGSSAPAGLSGLGLTSFDLAGPVSIPEPSSIALGIMGASAFLMRLRRKQ